ncbi:response regulator receiver [Labilithrix luteola]|uniref:Response regulator receiver n=1 Tax=Labilithrix luteola TaxID=1391654 RepID=A0A0K1Q1R4_9BACT|nr:hypothetical protein [Labilithrix luteola]AKU99725.1 response regulator receiver [Labilithrix luteola]
MSASSSPPVSAGSRHPGANAANLAAALCVHAEPLVAGARVLVLGNAELDIGATLLDLGARSVHVYDSDGARAARAAASAPRGVIYRAGPNEIDARDGAYDLALVPDLAQLRDAESIVGQLRRLLGPAGAVVAMARARMDADAVVGSDGGTPLATVGPATLAYAELYDLFALCFEHVTFTGVLPFAGVVFAELGENEDLAVSVDTRLAEEGPPDVFVVLASREANALEPYAIVQVAREEAPAATDVSISDAMPTPVPPALLGAGAEDLAAFAATRLQVELLVAQLEEQRERVAIVDADRADLESRLEQANVERDAAVERGVGLEEVIEAAQQALASMERRLGGAERGMLERDDRIAALSAELEASREGERQLGTGATADVALPAPEMLADVAHLASRAERAEAALALQVADLAQVVEAHAVEMARVEDQLRERAGVIAEMERELVRRESFIKELVVTLEEAREGQAPVPFEAPFAAPEVDPAEMARMRRKLDELAMEVARREGELVAQAWRIEELENARETSGGGRASEILAAERRDATQADLEGDLGRARDELAVLRQALTQEHAARVAAESGEELTRARAELQRQAVLLEQLRARDT